MALSICQHESCVYSSLQGLSNGFTYGAKVRFTHSLVMAILFSKEPYLKRLQRIITNTLEHGRRLGLFVMIFKSLVCVLNRVRKVNSPVHHFISGTVASYFIWSEESSISTQISLYLLSRVIIGSIRVLYMKLGISNKILEKYSISVINLVAWASSMFLFNYDKKVLQSSMAWSMNSLYVDSDKWNGWKVCVLGTFKRLFHN